MFFPPQEHGRANKNKSKPTNQSEENKEKKDIETGGFIGIDFMKKIVKQVELICSFSIHGETSIVIFQFVDR